jgi:ABC-type transport system involved in multi-copper enzyme maturation permease subunit
LRLLMTFELKRSHFLLKKVLGTFIFVNMVILIPYLISFIVLLLMFPSLITIGFIQQWLLYLLAICIFATCFILLGIWTSLITKSPGKSLSYAIFCWVALLMILPMTMPLIAGKFRHDKSFDTYQKEIEMVWNIKAAKWFEVGKRNDIEHHSHLIWNGMIDQLRILAAVDVENVHVNYIRDFYKLVFPLNKRLSELRILRDRAENNTHIFSDVGQFYNPRTCLARIAENISGCSMSDYSTFLTDANQIRDKIIDQGIHEQWLFSRQFFAVVDTSLTIRNLDQVKSAGEMIRLIQSHSFQFQKPNLPPYEYKELSLWQMLTSSYLYFSFLLLFIIGFFLWDLNLFKKYDIR